MTEVGKKAKLNFHWKVSPYDFSKEKLNRIIAKASKKYNLPKNNIRVVPDFIMVDEKGEKFSLTNDIISNIQDPLFQIKLFNDYLDINKIEDYDFELIKKIDSEINGKIDYKIYDKYRRYAIKWVRWSNFLSYGGDNFFDFSGLHGLVLLNGRNQSGKTTLALDLVRFLLFGNITKYQTQDKIFNKFIPEATKVEVEGCITIDDCDYIIKRTLNRPSLERRTTKSKVNQKVEYYRIINGSKEELEDYADNQQEENSVQTNKKIKEIIGREEDFDLVMSVTDATLDSLIEKKDTERGRLFSRWIGLLPIEEKDALAREKFNQEIKPYLMSNKYDIETVKQEIGAYNVLISDLEKRQKTYKKQNETIEKEIGQLEESRNTLMQSKQKIDDTLLKIDITTLNRTIETITDEGKKKKFELDKVISEINEIGDVEFSVNAYDNLVSETNKLSVKRGVIAEQYKNLTHNIEHLKSSEFCPTCGKKLDNVDNTAKINELKETLKNITDEGISLKKLIDENEVKINSMKDAREKYTRKSNLTVQKSAYELNIEKLRGQLIEKRNILKEYEKNSEAIDINNKLDIQIRNTELAIKEKRSNKDTNNRYIVNNENIIDQHKKEIAAREELIKKIEEETILVKNWKIYLDMVGKNGISKMVLRKTLPIINARLAQLLSDVCDFDVELDMNARNEVAFFIIKNGIKSDLSGGSGFEKTAASLALRSVLADISTMPRNNGILVDEVMGRVDEENYDNMHNLMNKMLNGYDYILSVNHIKECKDWFNTIIEIEKIDNVSKVTISRK